MVIHNGSLKYCHDSCYDSAIVLYNSSAIVDNCFCHGHEDRRNISIHIHPSDIVSRDSPETCKGFSVYCKLLTNNSNWCSVLDEELNKAAYQNTPDDLNSDILFRNYFPKCVNKTYLNVNSITDTHKSNLTIGMCKARCKGKNYFIPNVRIC